MTGLEFRVLSSEFRGLRWLVSVLLLLICFSSAGWSQDREQRVLPDVPDPVIIEANVIEAVPSSDGGPMMIHAVGEVFFQQGEKRLYADEFFYDGSNNTGRLVNVTFTTCPVERPEYRVTAKEIRLTQSRRLKLKRARIYLGNFRLLSLPKLSINVGPRQRRNTFIPRPGYNSRDGFFLASSYAVVNTDTDDIEIRLRSTAKRGIHGGAVAGHAIKGDLVNSPALSLDADSELRREAVVRPIASEDPDTCAIPDAQTRERQLAVFGSALYREPVLDIDVIDTLVSRLPEVGVRYVTRPGCLTLGEEQQVVGVQGELRTTWGNYKETPGNGDTSRWDIRGIGTTTFAVIDDRTAIRGTGLARHSSYGTGQSFTVLGGAIDVTRIFPGGSYASLKLIGHATSGETPFEFDDIDILHELQVAGRYVRGRHTFGVVLDYDLSENSLRDWQVSYARRMHCIEPRIAFRKRLSQVSLSIRVLGLQ